jgi:hypothetical protein
MIWSRSPSRTSIIRHTSIGSSRSDELRMTAAMDLSSAHRAIIEAGQEIEPAGIQRVLATLEELGAVARVGPAAYFRRVPDAVGAAVSSGLAPAS